MYEGRKTITFKREDRDQNLAYIFLDKIRYEQTNFVAKLICDFIKQNNIDINDYAGIKKICQAYLDGSDECAIDVKVKDVNELLGEIGSLRKEIKELASNINASELSVQNSSTVGQVVQRENLHNDSRLEKTIPIQGKSASVPEEVNDDEDSEDLGNLLSSFKMMAET